ncbi:FAD binding domain-containing protein [Candidatus Omnitrophota bacterium]
MLLNPFTYHAPTEINDAVKLFSTLENVKICAGGTFLINNLKLIKKHKKQGPTHVVSLKKIEALRTISFDSETLVLGAMTTMQEIVESDLIHTHFPILKLLATNIGSTPIRHMATIGGNIASRYVWTEWPTVLLALEAKLVFDGCQPDPLTLSIDEYLNKPSAQKGLLTKIIIKKNVGASINYQRVARSTTLDLPLIGVCIRARLENNRFTATRVSINNGTHAAQRDLMLEEFLNNHSDLSTIAKESLRHRDMALYGQENQEYKQHMFDVSIKKAITAITEKNGQ